MIQQVQNNSAELLDTPSRASESTVGIKGSPMDALLRKIGGVSFFKIGEIAEGTVLEKRGARIYVNFGARGIGIIYGREFYAATDLLRNLKPGDPISGKVTELDNEDGYIELSLKEAGDERRWTALKKLKEEGTVFDSQVVDANRGGLMLEVEGVQGFLPASQLSTQHYPRVDGGDKEKIQLELKKLIGTAIKVKVFDLDQKEQKLIFTEKGLHGDEMKEILAKHNVGDVVEGVITGVVDFGAFMKFGEEQLEGLIHISEIDWTLIEDPRDNLSVGEEVKAKIIDMQNGKISLSLKALKEDPWLKVMDEYKKGDSVKGRVTKINPFGAFVQLSEHFHGLAHVSEFGTEDVMREKLEVGKEYDFSVLLIDPKEHRLLLGLPGSKPKEDEEVLGEAVKKEEGEASSQKA